MTPAKQEVWDLFDKDLNFRGTFIRGNGYIPADLYHKTVEVIPTDMEGNLLLTRRAMTKRIAAGQLEFPAGSVISGETEENAAVRELEEETGLRAKKIYFMQRARSKGIIRYTYVAYIPDLMTTYINYAKDEVMGYRFATFQQWQALLTTQEYNQFRTACYTPQFMQALKSLVNRYAKEAKQKEKPPLKASSGLCGKSPGIWIPVVTRRMATSPTRTMWSGSRTSNKEMMEHDDPRRRISR